MRELLFPDLIPLVARTWMLAVSLWLVAILQSAGQNPDTLKYPVPPPPVGKQGGAALGSSVAVSGNICVAGAPNDDAGGSFAGVARVFDTSNGALLHTFLNPDPVGCDYFGTSVSISGMRVIVGSPKDNTGAIRSGSVFVYDLSSPTPTVPVVALRNPTPAVTDEFGRLVAADGTRVAVADRVGNIFVYDLASPNPTIPLTTLRTPNPTWQGGLGSALALSGTRVAVGAADNGGDGANSMSGTVYIFDLASADPNVPVFTLMNPTPGYIDQFGSAVAIDGPRVVVGAQNDSSSLPSVGIAYMYDLAGGTPTVPAVTFSNPTPWQSERFGASVAISGTRVAIGVPGENNDPYIRAYAYDLAGATPGVPVQMFQHPSQIFGSDFGLVVALQGSRLVISAPGDDTEASDVGRVYAYDLAGQNPTAPIATLNHQSPANGDQFGYSVAISGTRMVVGSPRYGVAPAYDAGSAYIYDLAGATPAVPIFTLDNPTPALDDNFGNAVAISGNIVVIGAPRDDTGANQVGTVYIYDLSSPFPTTPVLTLNNPGPAVDDLFGATVAANGNRVIVGVPQDDTGASNAGSAYVYDLGGATPAVPTLTLNNPAPSSGDSFGCSVGISGSRVVVGAYLDDATLTDSGTAYVYDLASVTPTVPVTILKSPTPGQYAYFGWAVAVSGTRVVAGAYRDYFANGQAGGAYVYDMAGPNPAVSVLDLKNPSPLSGENFGYSVAISGTRVLVGDQESRLGSVSDIGSAYVYDMTSSTPAVPVVTLNNPNPAPGDEFGSSVAIDGTTAIVGARLDASLVYSKGFVYVYAPSPISLWKLANLGSATAPDLDDPDKDGIVTLAEYGLNTLPHEPNPAPIAAMLVDYPEGERLRILIQRDPARSDVTIEVEAASNLNGPWTLVASSKSGDPFVGPGYVGGDSATPGLKSVEIRDIVNVTDAAQRFLRVNVTR